MPTSTRKSNKLLPIAGGIALVALAGILTWKLTAKPDLPDGILSGNGRIEATEYDISAKQAGRLDSVYVHEGDSVAARQVLATMNTDDLRANLLECQAQLHVAETERSRAEALASAKRSERSLAEKDYLRYRDLYGKDVVSRQIFDQATTRRSAVTEDVRAAEAQIAGASSSMEVIRAKARVVANNIEDAKLKTPVSGRVLYRLAEPGEVIGAGGRVLTVLDLSDVNMTIFLPSSKAGRLAIGADARIVLDAVPDTPIPAKVSFVSPRAQFTPKEVETQTEREKLMFRVKLNIDPRMLAEHLREVKPGMTGVAYVKIDASTAWPENLRTKATK